MWIWRRVFKQERWGKVDLDGKDSNSVNLVLLIFGGFFYLSHIYPNLSDTSSPCRRLHTALESRWWAHQRLCTHKVRFPENSTWKFSLPKSSATCHTHSMQLIPKHTTLIRARVLSVTPCLTPNRSDDAPLTLQCNKTDKIHFYLLILYWIYFYFKTKSHQIPFTKNNHNKYDYWEFLRSEHSLMCAKIQNQKIKLRNWNYL